MIDDSISHFPAPPPISQENKDQRNKERELRVTSVTQIIILDDVFFKK